MWLHTSEMTPEQLNTDLLRAYLTAYFKTTPVELDRVVAAFEAKNVGKNEVLVSKGEVCRYCYFVCRGSVRAFFLGEDGLEATRYIAMENQFMTTVQSYVSETPTNEFIQATEKSELLCLSLPNFKKITQETTLARDLYARQLELAYSTNHWRLESFLKMTARERYDFLMKENPTIIQRLSNRIVASYLGITQESLSRLKAQK
ncbi:MAG: Crp/Fnr family transcriptional regulator [Cyclobacteriaceae bacterium]